MTYSTEPRSVVAAELIGGEGGRRNAFTADQQVAMITRQHPTAIPTECRHLEEGGKDTVHS
jgi:hypothetical protein